MAPRLPARGFTYIGLIILVAIIALVGAAGLKMGSLLERAAAEEELLEIGAQFSEALRSYAAATPQGQPPQPPGLQELLKDPRFPNPRRHLRKIFVDPMTGKAEWGVIYLGDKVGVLGVHSLSDARPLKVANFDIRFLNMENRERISDWRFLIAGGEGLIPNVATPPNSMTAPPSLFPPAASIAPAAGGKPEAPQQPPAPQPPPPEPASPAEREQEAQLQPEEAQPMEPPTAEDPAPEVEGRERDRDKEAEASASAASAGSGPAAIVTPPPAQRRR